MRHQNGSNEQREGRALRQGNQNAEVSIVRYVTEGSFDIFMWQTVERKAAFIHQVMRGNVAGREVDDIGEQALSYAEVKALASGNPLLLEKAGVDNEVARLSRLRRAHHQDQARLARVLDTAEARASHLRAVVAQCDGAIARRIPTRGDRFRMTLDGETFSARSEAGKHLRATLAAAPAGSRDVGSLGGFPVDVVVERDALGSTAHLQLRGTPVRLSFDRHEINGVDPVGLVQRLEHRLTSLEGARDDAKRELERVEGEIEMATNRIGARFGDEDRLGKLLERQTEIARALQAAVEATAPTTPATEQEPGNSGRGPSPVEGGAELPGTVAGVRAACEAIVGRDDRGGGGRTPTQPDRYQAALDQLERLPALPGQLGDAVAAVLSSPADPPRTALVRISRSLGRSSSSMSDPRTTPLGPDTDGITGLQQARDESFDRVVQAVLAVTSTQTAGDARAWAGVLDRAVDALAAAGAADLPLAGPKRQHEPIVGTGLEAVRQSSSSIGPWGD